MFLDEISESLFDFANLVDRSERILVSREQQPNPLSDDRERITRAREAAEALFKPNPGKTPPVPETAPANQAVRKPRVLQIVSPSASVRRTEPERSVRPPPPAGEIARSQFGRIRTWVKYGMTAAQVAEIYGVPASEIERILGKG